MPDLKKLLEYRCFELNNMIIEINNEADEGKRSRHGNIKMLHERLAFNVRLYQFLYKGNTK